MSRGICAGRELVVGLRDGKGEGDLGPAGGCRAAGLGAAVCRGGMCSGNAAGALQRDKGRPAVLGLQRWGDTGDCPHSVPQGGRLELDSSLGRNRGPGGWDETSQRAVRGV